MNYSENIGDIAIIELNTTGFEELSHVNKKLAFYLSEAGLWGKRISLEQGSKYNIPLLTNLIKIYEQLPPEQIVKNKVKETLFMLFAHNGIYHTMSGEKLELPLQLDDLESIKQVVDEESYKVIHKILSNKNIPLYKTVQSSGFDVVKESGCNFYENLTTKEVEEYRAQNQSEEESVKKSQLGFNERLSKNKGKIVKEVIYEKGLYGKYIKKIIQNLRQALEFTETEEQYNSIKTLITFYETGSPVDFDKHSVAWVQDKSSDIYFINGLIESYKDPLGVACNFESIVAFKDPNETKKVEKIIKFVQYFEDNLPVEERFKKEKATGLSASSINVISMAGDTSPSLPLGVNLPNSAWIREDYGSKSVTLSNVDSSRSEKEQPLTEEFYLDKYQDVIKKYGQTTGTLHIDLHEIVGHGSCKVLPGVNKEDLSTYYSVIEECRADLVALYYVADKKLKEIGVLKEDVDIEEAALAKYVTYLTNGVLSQLRRVKLGTDLTQAHFRNRQLISSWILDNSDKSKIYLKEENGKTYLHVEDVFYAQKKFGELLKDIQRIKSTGDFKAAQDLVEKYGTKVNQNLHKEVLDRVSKLELPLVVGFITPELQRTNSSVGIYKPKDFLEQKIRFYKKYCS